MHAVTVGAVVHDGKPWPRDDDGNTIGPASILEDLGYTQREVNDPKYGSRLVLNGPLINTSPQTVVTVLHLDGEVLAVIDRDLSPEKRAKAKKAAKKSVKKAAKKKPAKLANPED